jgi:hypothetical protein
LLMCASCLLLSVDALSSGTITSGEISSLAHEAWDDSVEGGSWGLEGRMESTGKAKALLSSAKSTEVLGSLWDDRALELHDDTSDGGSVSGHVEEYSAISHF